MPNYGFKCGGCKHEWDEHRNVAERNDTECPKCKGEATRSYGKSTTRFFPFKSMWYHDICETPLFIESKKQLKQECDKYGVVACRLL